jgi:hypothetical protein
MASSEFIEVISRCLFDFAIESLINMAGMASMLGDEPGPASDDEDDSFVQHVVAALGDPTLTSTALDDLRAKARSEGQMVVQEDPDVIASIFFSPEEDKDEEGSLAKEIDEGTRLHDGWCNRL